MGAREGGPRVDDHLLEGQVELVAERQALERDVPEHLVQVARVAPQVRPCRVASRPLRRRGRLAHVEARVGRQLVRALELVVVDLGPEAALQARVGGGRVGAAEHGVGGVARRHVEEVERLVRARVVGDGEEVGRRLREALRGQVGGLVGGGGVGREGGGVLAHDAHEQLVGSGGGGGGGWQVARGDVGAVLDDVGGAGAETQDGGEWQVAQAVDARGRVGAVGGGQDGVAGDLHLLGDGVVLGVGGAVEQAAEVALRDGGCELGLRRGGRHHGPDRGGAGALAEDGDAVGIAAKVGDVGSDPVQGGDLVCEAVVAVGDAVVESQEPERREAVVDGDDDDVSSRREAAPVEGVVAARPAGEGASVDPEHDGLQTAAALRLSLRLSVVTPFRVGKMRRPDVEEVTVLGSEGWALRASIAKGRGRDSLAGTCIQLSVGESLWLGGIADAIKAKARPIPEAEMRPWNVGTY